MHFIFLKRVYIGVCEHWIVDTLQHFKALLGVLAVTDRVFHEVGQVLYSAWEHVHKVVVLVLE